MSSTPSSAYAANWVWITSGYNGDIYLDTQSVRYVGDNIVKVATRSSVATGYDLVLEKYSLEFDSMQMEAILMYSHDGSLINWDIIDNHTMFFGDSYKKINEGSDGIKVLAYLKGMAREGLIPEN